MQAIEITWRRFFEQFATHVFIENDFIEDPENKKYPRITFSYAMGDFLTDTMTTFQVWDWGYNNARLWEVCNKITKAVPVVSGTDIIVLDEVTGKTAGELSVWRGRPFLIPSPKDEPLLRARYGMLQARYRNIV